MEGKLACQCEKEGGCQFLFLPNSYPSFPVILTNRDASSGNSNPVRRSELGKCCRLSSQPTDDPTCFDLVDGWAATCLVWSGCLYPAIIELSCVDIPPMTDLSIELPSFLIEALSTNSDPDRASSKPHAYLQPRPQPRLCVRLTRAQSGSDSIPKRHCAACSHCGALVLGGFRDSHLRC